MENPLVELMVAVKRSHGKDLSVYDSMFLAGVLKNRRTTTDTGSLEEYLRYISEHGAETDLLLQALTITYSQFFRDPFTYSFLQQSIIPNLVNRKQGGELRIWSAGCAGGQEAYSIAVLIEDAATLAGQPIRYRIFATDISPSALTQGRQGCYTEEAVGNCTVRQARDYFIKTNGMYTVVPLLRQQVDFSNYDLLDMASANPPQSIYGDFDLIFCCNLLFYYQPETRSAILKKLTKSLSRAGYLVTGETERGFVQDFNKLRMVAPLSTVFQMGDS
jgi:chemotaxis methyl-accepting protein methylase